MGNTILTLNIVDFSLKNGCQLKFLVGFTNHPFIVDAFLVSGINTLVQSHFGSGTSKVVYVDCMLAMRKESCDL